MLLGNAGLYTPLHCFSLCTPASTPWQQTRMRRARASQPRPQVVMAAPKKGNLSVVLREAGDLVLVSELLLLDMGTYERVFFKNGRKKDPFLQSWREEVSYNNFT